MKTFLLALTLILILTKSFESTRINDALKPNSYDDEHLYENHNGVKYSVEDHPYDSKDSNEVALLSYQNSNGAAKKENHRDDKVMRVGPVKTAYLIFNGKLLVNGEEYKKNGDLNENGNVGRDAPVHSKVLNNFKNLFPNYIALRKAGVDGALTNDQRY